MERIPLVLSGSGLAVLLRSEDREVLSLFLLELQVHSPASLGASEELEGPLQALRLVRP